MQRALSALKLIAGAMIASTAAVAIALTLAAPARDPERVLWLTYAALGAALVLSALRPLVLARVEAQGLARIADDTFAAVPQSGQQRLIEEHGHEGRLFLVFQTKTVVGLALTESAAFLCAIAGRVDGGYLGGGAALLLCATMALGWPSQARWEAWKAGPGRGTAE